MVGVLVVFHLARSAVIGEHDQAGVAYDWSALGHDFGDLLMTDVMHSRGNAATERRGSGRQENRQGQQCGQHQQGFHLSSPLSNGDSISVVRSEIYALITNSF